MHTSHVVATHPDRWKQLAADVAKYGIRNGYLMAVAPTGSTSNIANTTAGIDPIFKNSSSKKRKALSHQNSSRFEQQNILALQRGTYNRPTMVHQSLWRTSASY